MKTNNSNNLVVTVVTILSSYFKTHLTVLMLMLTNVITCNSKRIQVDS